MPGTDLLVAWDDWSGGDFGRLGGRVAPPGSFAALNLQRYLDGSLGLRAGLKSLAPTGLGNGALRGIGWSQYATNGSPDRLWYIQGTTVYSFNGEATGDAATSYTGSLAATSTYPVQHVDTINASGQPLSYITIDGDKAYKLNHSARTVTALSVTGADEAGGRPICIYGDRLVCQSKDTGNRVLFSAAGDFDTAWPAANYFDVGDGSEITGLFVQRGQLKISKQDGSWWTVTGTLGVNHVLRRGLAGVSPAEAPHEPDHAAVLGDGDIVFVSTYHDFPVLFTGSQIDLLRHLAFGDFSVTLDQLPAQAKVTALQYPDEVLIGSGRETSLSDDRALMRKNGVWTLHTFGTEVAWWAAGPTGRVCVAKDGDGSNPPAFYVWETDLERPAIAADSFARVGDLSDTPLTATLTTPQWWAPHGGEVRVQKVIVDFRKWDTGAATDNNITITVDALGAQERAGTVSSASQSWTEASGTASTSGTEDRVVKSFGGTQGFASGFQIRLTALRGVAIRAIRVYGETRATTPRG